MPLEQELLLQRRAVLRGTTPQRPTLQLGEPFDNGLPARGRSSLLLRITELQPELRILLLELR